MTVSKQLTIGDLVENNRVDLHTNIILGDNGLRREIRNLLHQVNTNGDAINKGDLNVNTVFPCLGIGSQTLYNKGARLRNDVNVADKQRQSYNSNNGKCNKTGRGLGCEHSVKNIHSLLPFKIQNVTIWVYRSA